MNDTEQQAAPYLSTDYVSPVGIQQYTPSDQDLRVTALHIAVQQGATHGASDLVEAAQQIYTFIKG